MLLGFAAISIDGSNLYRERGDVQNAADLAAIAAAYNDCIGGADPAAAGLAQAAANGYTHDGSDIVVTVAKEGDNWRATIATTVDDYFSGLVGVDTLSTGATAAGYCTSSKIYDYALFAGGACGPETLKVAGSSNTLDSAIHSNDQTQLSGSSNAMNGGTTTVNGINVGGANNTFTPPADTVMTVDVWPVIFDSNNFLPGGLVEAAVTASDDSSYYHFWDGKIDVGVLMSEGRLNGTTLADGVYVATDDIDLAGQSITGKVTFVTAPTVESKGIITLSGSNQQLAGFYENLLAFSDAWKGSPGPECHGVDGIHLSGSGHAWDGIMFAPRSGLVLSGSNNTSVRGTVVAHTIQMTGSFQGITAIGPPGSATPVTVLAQ